MMEVTDEITRLAHEKALAVWRTENNYHSAKVVDRLLHELADSIIGLLSDEPADPVDRALTLPLPPEDPPEDPPKCDGDHGGEPCGDPECWQLEAPAAARRPGQDPAPSVKELKDRAMLALEEPHISVAVIASHADVSTGAVQTLLNGGLSREETRRAIAWGLDELGF